MSYLVKQLDDLPVPVVLQKIAAPFNYSDDIPPSLSELSAILSRIDSDVIYIIIDPSDSKMSLTDVTRALAAAFVPGEGAGKAPMFDQRLRLIMVGDRPLIKLAADSARQDQYGNRSIALFKTLDEALDHIRQAVKA